MSTVGVRTWPHQGVVLKRRRLRTGGERGGFFQKCLIHSLKSERVKRCAAPFWFGNGTAGFSREALRALAFCTAENRYRSLYRHLVPKRPLTPEHAKEL